MKVNFLAAPLFAVLCAGNLFAGQPEAPDTPLVAIDQGRVYRTVNEDAINGKDIVDLLLEEQWDKHIQAFVDNQLGIDEVISAKLEITEPDVEAEFQALMKYYADKLRLNAGELKPEILVKQIGLAGGVSALRRQVRVSLGLLKLFQREGKLPMTAHIWERPYKEQVAERLDKVATQKGVERDLKKLGAGVAVRIGFRDFTREDIRAFAVDSVTQVSVNELKSKLDILTFERLASKQLKEKSIELKEDDLSFHFSYLCRKMEAETGVPGRLAMSQQLQAQQMTAEQFMHDRRVKADAIVTLLAKTPIRTKQLQAEFEAKRERYKRDENLVAHILIRVLDPDGRPYTARWKAPGFTAVNQFVAKKREEQFEAFKPRIEALISEAQKDFEAAARKHSQDNATSIIGGKMGRIGKETLLLPPCDDTIRNVAMKLKPGEISPPVRSDYGWHLVKCLDKQDVTFDEAAERVYVNLIFEAKQKISEALMKDAKIEDKF